jgi:hypothetical protein
MRLHKLRASGKVYDPLRSIHKGVRPVAWRWIEPPSYGDCAQVLAQLPSIRWEPRSIIK